MSADLPAHGPAFHQMYGSAPRQKSASSSQFPLAVTQFGRRDVLHLFEVRCPGNSPSPVELVVLCRVIADNDTARAGK